MKYIVALLIFSLIVIIHELGHFLLAKRGGIRVNEFALGMGPILLSKQIGETKYCLKLLPFGGSCMMEGEDAESDSKDAFGKKSVWTRISVVAAGPIFNFILAFLLSLFIIGCIGYDEPLVVAVTEGYPAQAAGMEAGDKIVKLNDTPIRVYREVSMFIQMQQDDIQANPHQPITVVYERDGQEYTAELVPQLSENGMYYMGFSGSGVRTRGGVLKTIGYSLYEVKYWVSTTIQSLGMMFQGQVSADDVSGPVGIVSAIGETYESSKQDGTFYIVLNMAYISILLTANLGVMNLLPIPALDGGRLVFLFIEAIRGKPLDPKKEGMVHFAGLMLLMALMVLILFNDVRNIIF